MVLPRWHGVSSDHQHSTRVQFDTGSGQHGAGAAAGRRGLCRFRAHLECRCRQAAPLHPKDDTDPPPAAGGLACVPCPVLAVPESGPRVASATCPSAPTASRSAGQRVGQRTGGDLWQLPGKDGAGAEL